MVSKSLHKVKEIRLGYTLTRKSAFCHCLNRLLMNLFLKRTLSVIIVTGKELE